MCSVCIRTSTDLENWSDGKVIFECSDDFWATGEFWAAELHKYNGKYYLFVSFMSQCTQILVGDIPDGRFKPLTEWGGYTAGNVLYRRDIVC